MSFLSLHASETSVPKIVRVLQNAMRGKLNNTVDVTLTINSATSTFANPLIGPNSVLSFMPTTANAATGLTALYVTGRGNGTCTLNHANNAQADRTYAVSILG